MKEYDELIKELRVIIKKGSYCEDNKLRLRSTIKYDKPFIKKLHKELEYIE